MPQANETVEKCCGTCKWFDRSAFTHLPECNLGICEAPLPFWVGPKLTLNEDYPHVPEPNQGAECPAFTPKEVTNKHIPPEAEAERQRVRRFITEENGGESVVRPKRLSIEELGEDDDSWMEIPGASG